MNLLSAGITGLPVYGLFSYDFLIYEMLFPVIQFDQYHFFVGFCDASGYLSEYYTFDQWLIHLQGEKLKVLL